MWGSGKDMPQQQNCRTISLLVDREIMGYVKESHAHQRNRTKVSFWRPIAGNGAHATNGVRDFFLKTIRTDDPAPTAISHAWMLSEIDPARVWLGNSFSSTNEGAAQETRMTEKIRGSQPAWELGLAWRLTMGHQQQLMYLYTVLVNRRPKEF